MGPSLIKAEEEACDNPEITETTETPESAGEEDPNCPSRPHIVRCAGKHLDSNQNGLLERSELEAAIGELSWLARGVLKIIGSVDKIMDKCDHDRDGAISIEHDMEHTKETCLATCFKRRAFKKAFFPECDL
jgi:hypothetical protein